MSCRHKHKHTNKKPHNRQYKWCEQHQSLTCCHRSIQSPWRRGIRTDGEVHRMLFGFCVFPRRPAPTTCQKTLWLQSGIQILYVLCHGHQVVVFLLIFHHMLGSTCIPVPDFFVSAWCVLWWNDKAQGGPWEKQQCYDWGAESPSFPTFSLGALRNDQAEFNLLSGAILSGPCFPFPPKLWTLDHFRQPRNVPNNEPNRSTRRNVCALAAVQCRHHKPSGCWKACSQPSRLSVEIRHCCERNARSGEGSTEKCPPGRCLDGMCAHSRLTDGLIYHNWHQAKCPWGKHHSSDWLYTCAICN